MKRVLVTGANGFTGKYMLQQLKIQGFYVVSLGMIPVKAADENFICDLTDKVAVQEAVLAVKPGWVIHLAAISFVAHDDTDAIYKVNLLGTKYLLESLAELQNKPEAVLLASSAVVYGDVRTEVVTESVDVAPVNDYGVSKAAMEQLAYLWKDKLPIIITRPFNYTGVGQEERFLIPKVIDHFTRKSSLIELGNIDVEREFGDVRNVCQIYQKLLQTPQAIGKTFNICSGVAYSVQEILAMMEKIAGYQIEIKVNPDFVRENEIKRLAGDNALLYATIGMQSFLVLEETLKWMYLAKKTEL